MGTTEDTPKGAERESSRGITARAIAAVLAGQASYDDLGAQEQAVVRAEWDVRMTELRTSLDFEAEFLDAGETWVEADAHGP